MGGGLVSIVKKIILGFGILVVLLILIFSFQYFSSIKIETEGKAIQNQINDSKTIFTDFNTVNHLSDSIKALLQDIYKIGYIQQLQTLSELEEQISQQILTIESMATSDEIYVTIEEDFMKLKLQKDTLFIQKENELNALLTLAEKEREIAKLENKIYIANNSIDKLYDFFWNDEEFASVMTALEEEYGQIDPANNEATTRLSNDILTEAELKYFRFPEVEKLWAEDILSGVIPTELYLQIQIYSKDILAHPENRQENIKAITTLSEDMLSILKNKTASNFQPVIFVLLETSIEKYLNLLNELNNYLSEREDYENNIKEIAGTKGVEQSTIDQAKRKELEIINTNLKTITESIQNQLSLITNNQSGLLNDSLESALAGSQNSVSIMADDNKKILLIVLVSVLISIF